MERREFIKKSCSVCIAISAGLLMGSSLSSCSSVSVYKTASNQNKITVPVSLFAAADLQIIRLRDSEYDIALRKEQDGNYTALLLRCTHADNQLNSTGNGFYCTLHGSRFDKEGTVTKGPAEHPLKKFTTEIINDNIIIHLT
jgi:Rieske Fe-S protein